MEQKISVEKINFVKEYINRLENEFAIYEDNLEFANNEDNVFDIISEIINVFKKELPELKDSVLFRSGSSTRDAKTVIGILKKYLIDNGYIFKREQNNQIDKFWASFRIYFENELPYTDLLKDEYIGYNNWNNGTYYVDIDYHYQFALHYGTEYSEENFANITNIKMFIELAFSHWIKIEKRYEFTKIVNQMFRKFKIPYKLNKGKVIIQGYKTTTTNDKIINYTMLERKIQFADEMILSNEYLDKKCALDYIVDSLQYLLSIQKGEKVKEKYSNACLTICKNKECKEYTMIYNEIDEIMKIANEYFDIRHNEYLNKAKEVREAITNPITIEYLYNRVYSLLYILKISYDNSQK